MSLAKQKIDRFYEGVDRFLDKNQSVGYGKVGSAVILTGL